MEKIFQWKVRAMTIVMIISLILSVHVSQASEVGRRNTTIGLGTLSAYLFTRRGNKIPAYIGTAATIYAYKRYQDSINARHRREAYYARQREYRAADQHAQYLRHQAILRQNSHSNETAAYSNESMKNSSQYNERMHAFPISLHHLKPVQNKSAANTNKTPALGGAAQAGVIALALGAGLGVPKFWTLIHTHFPTSKV
jgi:hypothetical protein